ncbi:SDR family oxidoreductase [Jannaschia aquimarina]|uniref:FabG_2 protein n=1 Tax=Jannaschia aquimarina TaxID=935700 RepID=A0A0D1DBN9_9RHOB|nr:SDR family oxidoreductase [Jannaschia aquimarina]KIT17393.1 3-oxoacyl-[acyl-carrier-protein] reductase FabG [Jannaschia aquimarina]SNT24548.1 NAD(P)-dependent dehydrogenase, short-chain alcohol dehydrogenase family [Jannaschia aquimarina]
MRALVTGGGARLGAAMAEELAALGFDVAVHFSRSEGGAKTTRDRIRRTGRSAETIQCDLLDLDAAGDLVPQAADLLGGPLTLLVNNASIFEHDDIDSATTESWDRHIRSNLQAPFILTQHFARQVPGPVEDENGEPLATAMVVNMVDQRVRKLTPEFMTYTLAKAGLWTFTQTSAQALAPRGIRVNAIGPGPTMQGARQSPAHFAAQRAATILGRGADPQGIRDALRYLVGARSVTGQLICVDGGQHLAWQTPDVLGVE